MQLVRAKYEQSFKWLLKSKSCRMAITCSWAKVAVQLNNSQLQFYSLVWKRPIAIAVIDQFLDGDSIESGDQGFNSRDKDDVWHEISPCSG